MHFPSLFKKKSTSVLGIEIIGRSIRWAEVYSTNNGFEVLTHGMLDTAHQLWNTSLDIEDGLVDSLAPLAAYRHLPLACVLPATMTQTAYLSIPLEERAKSPIEHVIKTHVESYIVEHDTLVTSDTVCLYDVLSHTKQRVEIAATFYRLSKVQHLTDILHALGFKDIQYIPFHDTLHALHMDHDPSLIISMADQTTSLFQLHEGTLRGFGSVALGASDIFGLIHDTVGEDLAPRVYARYGIKSNHRDPKLYKALVEKTQTITDLAQHMITESNKDHHLIIAGDHAMLPGLDTFFATQLRRTPRILEVWQRFIDPNQQLPVIDAHDMLRFAPALGAAVDYLDRQGQSGR
ncbi:hypothetical protein H6776_02645 [Candidatus Nomurabacteria bacterium]|nr:hypothetical protein [Candidatus Nomurabacteria bacterium]